MRRLLPQRLLAQYTVEGKGKKEFSEPYQRTIHAVLQRSEGEGSATAVRAHGFKDVMKMIRSVLKVSSSMKRLLIQTY